jgi:two-component system, cell cycle sensor histidine kinase and response regulator CckA
VTAATAAAVFTRPVAQPIRVLLVEDNPGDARLILELLREASAYEFDMERVDGLEAALDRLGRAGVDVVLLDLGLPDSQGLETFRRARQGAPDEPIVVISGLNDEEVALEAVRSGAQDYLVKGRIEGDLLARVIRYAIERRRADDALRAREAHYRTILENIGDAVFIVDRDGRLLDVNPRACELTGYTRAELLGLGFADTWIDADRAEVPDRLAEMAAGRSQFFERRLLRSDRTTVLVEASARVLPDGRLLSTLRDITERRGLEEQLRQAQKMEAVGRLAGGVAHDFNNVLSVIFGYAELMSEDLPADSPARQDVAEISKAAQRASALTRQLLAFSRQQVLQPVVLSLNDLVQDIGKLLQRLVPADVELRVALTRDIGNVRADPGQIEQVIMNLVVNARDAMPAGGKLLIETANAELTEQYADQHQPVVAGEYVMLAVSDTGVGMDLETRARIFEPFFTTKEKGKGTGLGLSTVYGIVKQSGGYVWVYSEPGRGTTFKLYLPRVDAPAEPQAAPRETSTLTGTETVLLAEDDDMLRPLSKSLLERLGYTVLDAANAAEALAIAREHRGPIHLLLADVVMPGASGRQLATRLAGSRPETRALYVSGYTDDAIVQHGMLEPGLAFLQKPFTPAALARKVRETLDAK